MNIPKTSPNKNDPPAPGIIELDTKSIKGYRNIDEQGQRLSNDSDRALIHLKKPSIRNGGVKPNITFKKMLSSVKE
jgi:hypothetical protein